MCVGVLFFVAENKKGFVLYADLIHTISKLPNETKGKLFQLILDYVNDLDPVPDDLLLEISFEPIKQQLKRDLVKWEKFREKQSLNGKRGGRPKNPSLFNESQKSLKVKVTDTVIVTDKDNVKDMGYYRQFAHLRISEKEVSKLLDDGFTMQQVDDILDSIQNFKGNKKYTSLYLTARKWLKRDREETTKVKPSKLAGADEIGKQVDQKIINEINQWKQD